MHEFSIVDSLLEQIGSIAEENDFSRITDVAVEIGELKLIIPEMMQTAFEAATQNTLSQGAKLKITEKKTLAICRNCKNNFSPQIHDFQCPSCSLTDVTVLEGNDIVLVSVKGTQKDENIKNKH